MRAFGSYFLLLRVMLFFCLLPIFSYAQDAYAQNIPTQSLTVQAIEGGVDLTSHILYFTDTQDYSIDEIMRKKAQFNPYNFKELFQKEGRYWFYLNFDPILGPDNNAEVIADIANVNVINGVNTINDINTINGVTGTLDITGTDIALLDLARQLPTPTKVFVLPAGMLTWQELIPERDFIGEFTLGAFDGDLYDLTPLQNGGDLLIQTLGAPAPWFVPMLWSAEEAPITPERRLFPLVFALLLVLGCICVWRSALEINDIRFWVAVMVFATVFHFLWGVPAIPTGILDPSEVPGLLAVALCVMLIPNIGRHLMLTRKYALRMDSVLLWIGMLGPISLVLCILPFGSSDFVVRLFSLWPLYAIFSLFATLFIIKKNLAGTFLYIVFCFCLIGAGLFSLSTMGENPVGSLGDLIAMVFVSFIVILLPIRSKDYEEEDEYAVIAQDTKDFQEQLLCIESHLREPLDSIIRETSAIEFDITRSKGNLTFGTNSLEDKKIQRIRQHTESLITHSRDLSNLIGQMSQLTKSRRRPLMSEEVFNLRDVIISALASIQEEAQERQVGLGWYMAPQMGLMYSGDKTRLEDILQNLLRDAVASTQRGIIGLRVRRSPFTDPGHLIFSINDSSNLSSPIQRNIFSTMRAWEFANSHGGEIEIQSFDNGFTLSFGMVCKAMDMKGEYPLPTAENYLSRAEAKGLEGDEGTVLEVSQAPILVVSPLSVQRQTLAWYLSDYEVWEASNVEDALKLYDLAPARLIVLGAALSLEQCVFIVGGIRVRENMEDLSPAPFLAFYSSVEDSKELDMAGCEFLLAAEARRRDILITVEDIVQKYVRIDIYKDVDKGLLQDKMPDKNSVYAERLTQQPQEQYFDTDQSLDFDENQKLDTIEDMGKDSEEKKSTYPYNYSYAEVKESFFGRFISSIRPKPHIDNKAGEQAFRGTEWVGEAMPISTSQDLDKKDLYKQNLSSNKERKDTYKPLESMGLVDDTLGDTLGYCDDFTEDRFAKNTFAEKFTSDYFVDDDFTGEPIAITRSIPSINDDFTGEPTAIISIIPAVIKDTPPHNITEMPFSGIEDAPFSNSEAISPLDIEDTPAHNVEDISFLDIKDVPVLNLEDTLSLKMEEDSARNGEVPRKDIAVQIEAENMTNFDASAQPAQFAQSAESIPSVSATSSVSSSFTDLSSMSELTNLELIFKPTLSFIPVPVQTVQNQSITDQQTDKAVHKENSKATVKNKKEMEKKISKQKDDELQQLSFSSISSTPSMAEQEPDDLK